jgi:D-serine deaminase-like pyridoxal phosphate-dependent protein
MDLKTYYQKIKEIESKIPDPFAVIVSLDTGDGGRAGIQTEVSRALAAKMIVEGIARMATADEKQALQKQRAAGPPPAK